ncbi:MAG: glycosyltransferase [Phycisphaerales bacterium JB043]
MRDAFERLGWEERFFRPSVSCLGDVQALATGVRAPDLLWVSCFRQRDVRASWRWARKRGVPVVFDALISAYDKRVFERGKFSSDSSRAKKLLKWERELLALPDVIVVDTEAHASFFNEALGVEHERIVIVPVGAEEGLFEAAPMPASNPTEVLFYGSFIGLQDPETIVEAACRCPGTRWTLLGDGPLRERCEQMAHGHDHISFEDPVPYRELASRIHRAYVLLGIFGTSAKASRVIPNKVYQSLACGRPVITRASEAYPQQMLGQDSVDSGVVFVPAGDGDALAHAARKLISQETLGTMGQNARRTYEQWFSARAVGAALERVIDKCVG